MSNLPVNTLLQGGKYRIVRFINSGGFGCTYEAKHVLLEKRVAIKEFFVKKICNRDEATSRVSVGVTSERQTFEKLRIKFLTEARVLSEFSHPGIVRVSDVFEENGTAYYVMDYIDGPSLGGILKPRGPLPEARAVGYIRQVCAALQYVHSHNRLHLDIKPDNVMVDGADRAILIDFGVSKLYDKENGENNSILLGNTPGYAPLEQINDDVKKFLPATDLYALGATLYKLLTGATPPDAISRSNGDELPPLPACVSAATRSAVFAAMQLKKNERLQSVAEFLALLDGEAASELEVTIIGVPDTTVSNTINGHEYVDLGLSVKWATCNLGASSPSDDGNYYTWDEANPKDWGLKRIFGLCLRKTCGKKKEDDIDAGPLIDAARANWGGSWRLPTKSKLEELKSKCTWKWTTMNGKNGYKVTGRNGNSIFLPAAGWRDGSSLDDAGSYGNYWSSTPYESDSDSAFSLYFGSGDHDVGLGYRNFGRSVRPVSK